LTAGELFVDVTRRRVFFGERAIDLVPKEFDLLVFLMRNRGVALSRTLLLKHVWGEDFRSDPRTVDVHIRWLRTKIEPDAARPFYIETVRGLGYRFSEGMREAQKRPVDRIAQ
jgi:DNA-binding response OmpR family regulator